MSHLDALYLVLLSLLSGLAVGQASVSLRPDPVDDEESDREADRWERRQWGDR